MLSVKPAAAVAAISSMAVRSTPISGPASPKARRATIFPQPAASSWISRSFSADSLRGDISNPSLHLRFPYRASFSFLSIIRHFAAQSVSCPPDMVLTYHALDVARWLR